ncbi:MAG: DNA topoisomerase IV subunit A [Candidatus Aenigmarchaeota archaeon]|nr:DNA topoisomerase IV subunit A [Candidatus Aenigmarchaeota archaeon]
MKENKSREEIGKEIIKRLKEKFGDNILNDLKKGKGPSIDIVMRALTNIIYDEKKHLILLGNKTQSRSFFSTGQTRIFMQTLLVANACKELIKSGKTTSIRSLYYNTKHTLEGSKENTFEDQNESNPIIEDIEVSADALREELHLRANSKGAMVGDLTIVDTGDEINLRKMGSGGWAVPSIVEPHTIQFKKCDAKFILFIEKDTVWGRFNEDKFWKKHNCVIIHGGGQPPRGVRRLLKRMHDELKLPVYVLVDNDPWGFYIYSVIRQGSMKLAYESVRMAVPDAKFIGLSSFDKEKYKLPNEVTIKLNEGDKKRIKEILNYKWFQDKSWRNEMEHMLKQGVKLELEALSAKNIAFITETYLPEKIAKKEWLD